MIKIVRNLIGLLDAKKHIFKWILNKIGKMEFQAITKQRVIDAFLKDDKAPSKDIMNKNLTIKKYFSSSKA